MKKSSLLLLAILIGLTYSGCKKEKNDQDVILKNVYEKMVSQGLLQNEDYSQFLDNVNSASDKVNISENSIYDNHLDQTTTTIALSAKTGIVEDVTIVVYIPKEVVGSAYDITFGITPTQIIHEDPIIMWHITDIQDTPYTLSWIFKGNGTPTSSTTYILTNNKYVIDRGVKYGDFGVTEFSYNDYSNWEYSIYSVFGPEYRVADWNDLKNYYTNGGNLLTLFDGLGLTEQGTSVLITRDGNHMWNSNRYYVASRHEHNKPSSYLAHDNIDNYLISLGSWYGMKLKILAVKNNK